MFVLGLCCVLPCRYRPCDGLTTGPGSPTVSYTPDQEIIKLALCSRGSDWKVNESSV
jgi:hypothetical protein